MNIFRTFGVCLVVCLLSLAGCSDNSNDKSSRPSREPHFQLSQSPKTELERMVQRADAGDPVAQNNLGAAYSDGEGVPEDDVEAYAWLSIAAVGDVDHEKNRDIVKESLSDSQLALGQRRATELFEKYGSGK